MTGAAPSTQALFPAGDGNDPLERLLRAPRAGLLGGTFDPPHIGHLVAARDAADALELDVVALVPAGRPPHKEAAGMTAADTRERMVSAAISGDPRLVLLEAELRRDGPSRTVDTLEEFVPRRPEGMEPLHLLMGADQWTTFPSWHRPERILELARVVVLTRQGDRGGVGPDARALEISVSRLDISSTDLRARVRRGRSIRDLVPDAVRRIIDSEGLYR
ncbi:MAG: nicotinate (nicotinamide) nucleotide adenylyltransferase [Gemmatimonadales bacterium]|nr:MAG: nicotinate (nicotinamide) nucleotide adenylyltransferase [Gemmatimonadales bacterium]